MSEPILRIKIRYLFNPSTYQMRNLSLYFIAVDILIFVSECYIKREYILTQKCIRHFLLTHILNFYHA